MRSAHQHCLFLALWLVLGGLPAAAQTSDPPRVTPWPPPAESPTAGREEPQPPPAMPVLEARSLSVDSLSQSAQTGPPSSAYSVRPAAAEDGPPAALDQTTVLDAVKLPPRKLPSAGALARPAAATPESAVGTVAASLGIVLGLFFVIVWVSKRCTPAGNALLPKEAVELLGRAALSGRQQMQLIRVGNKLLLLAVTPTSCETLTEVTDPAEVEHLLALCQRSRAGSSTAVFSQVLGQLSREPARGGFAGPTTSSMRGRT